MDRDIPVFNRPVMEKIFRKNQQKHLERLRNIKTGNSNRTMPTGQNVSLSNKKAMLAQEQKRTEIQKQNVLLFNKMRRIMGRNDPNNQPNMTQMSRINKNSFDSRIAQQNKGIFQRLEHQKPTISNKKLQQQRMKNLTILRFLGKYPNALANRGSTDMNMSQMGRKSQTKKKYDTNYRTGQNPQSFDLDEEYYDEELKNYQQQFQRMKEKSVDDGSGRRRFMSQAVNRNNNKVDSEQSQGLNKLTSVDVISQLNPSNNYRVQARQTTKNSVKSEHNQNELDQKTKFSGHSIKQITLFQKNCIISRNKALVNIVRLYNMYKIRVIFQQPIKGQTTYEVQIPEQQGNQFFSQNNYDYNKICRMLVIQDGSLVVNPSILDDGESSAHKLESKPSQKMAISQKQNVIFSQGRSWAKYQQALEESIQ